MDAKVELKMNPWHPMTDPVDLKHIGKLLEELGELTAALSRCMIQGVDECEPVTGKRNRDWLEQEVADVLAGIELLTEHFSLDKSGIYERSNRKKVGLRSWHVVA